MTKVSWRIDSSELWAAMTVAVPAATALFQPYIDAAQAHRAGRDLTT